MKIRIQEPYWGAVKKYGWAKGIWGVGFKREDIDKAIKNKEKLEVKVWKYPLTYEISPVTVKNYATANNTTFTARHNALLYVVPCTKLRKKDARVQSTTATNSEPDLQGQQQSLL
jgi:hypothetical protein